MALRGAIFLSLSPSPSPSPSPYTIRGRRPVVVVAAAVAGRRRRPQNVDGDFYVDHRCIDCDTCRWMAPEVFTRADGKSAVTKQPSSEDEMIKALQALLSCPTNSIHNERPTKKILEVHKMFPLPIDEIALPVNRAKSLLLVYTLYFYPSQAVARIEKPRGPRAIICSLLVKQNLASPVRRGVYHCGYHSEKSYGATSYLITHPEGNILVDCPRYKAKLVRNVEMLGGARYMFLTHKDDVGDHEKWSERLKCERILHSGDVEASTVDVEIKLHGEGPWSIGNDFELVHTPGHTKGSVCLYYKPLKVLFTGDHLAKSEESDDLVIFPIYNRHSVTLQLDSVRKLIDLNFEWILPGHGRRIRFKDNQEKNSALEACLVNELVYA